MLGLLVALGLLTLVAQIVTLCVCWPRPVVKAMLPVLTDALDVAACELTTTVEPLAISGEAKRHQVYAALIKQFPTTPKRDLAHAIERVMQQRPRD